ncbi:biotin/lipoyl-containing protein, partial [Cellulomonas carbonis]
MIRAFTMPDLGEGLTESELVTWHVAVGDRVELNQVVAEVETAKALVSVPSPFAGVVARLEVEEGAVVPVGAPILAVDVAEPARVEDPDGAVAVGVDGATTAADGAARAESADGAGQVGRAEPADGADRPAPAARTS